VRNFRVQKENATSVVLSKLRTNGFERFIEDNGKQLTKTNIANKVSPICVILLYILASAVSSLMLFAFSSPIKHLYELYVSCCPISFYVKCFH
jgi:hypothetical protein